MAHLTQRKQNITRKNQSNKNIFVEWSQSNSNQGRDRFPPFSRKACLMSMKAYKYRIYASKGTTEKLQWTLDRCRELYNAALIERRDAYEMHVKRHPAYYDEDTRK